MVYPITKRIAMLITLIFVKKVSGIEDIPKKGPFIVASNHGSYLDPLLLAYYVVRKTNQKVHFIAYRGRFAFLGNLIVKKWAGCILIRYNKKEVNAALKEAVAILKKKGIVGIFPVAPHHNLKKPGTGVAKIALAAHCPILPAAIKGTEEIMPAPSLIPRRTRRASLQFMRLLTFKKNTKNFNIVANKVGKTISSGLNKK